MSKWKKGESGNAGGRPKEIGDLRILARERTEQALETLAEVMLDKNAPPNARVAASSALLDRGYGKATTMLAAEPPANKPIDIMDAARRIAFIINSANILGEPLPDAYKVLMNPVAGDCT